MEGRRQCYRIPFLPEGIVVVAVVAAVAAAVAAVVAVATVLLLSERTSRVSPVMLLYFSFTHFYSINETNFCTNISL